MLRVDQSKLTPNGMLFPLISINTLIDTDIGLYNLIKSSFLNYSVFRKDFFALPLNKVIKALYYRREENPLSVMVNDNIPEKDIDEYYKQFNEQYQKDILYYSINTNLVDAVELFKETGDIRPSILCYDDLQVEFIKNHDRLKDVECVTISKLESINKGFIGYTELYVKNLAELDTRMLKIRFGDIGIYLSTYGPNFNVLEDGSLALKDNAFLGLMLQKSLQSSVSIIDLYNNKTLGEENN